MSNADRDFLRTEIANQLYAKKFEDSEISLAIDTCIRLFDGYDFVAVHGFCHINMRIDDLTLSINVSSHLMPALLHAHQYFGDELPNSLIHKLVNAPQIYDTIFEISCLAFLNRSFSVTYEPKLCDGKVPDLLATLENGTRIYVECKSQGIIESEYKRHFQEASDEFRVVLKAGPPWCRQRQKEFRLEILPGTRLSSKDLGRVATTIGEYDDLNPGDEIEIDELVSIKAVARNEPQRGDLASPIIVGTVGTEPTRLTYEFADYAFYPWPNLVRRRIKSQRNLIKQARKQLRNIPSDALGMICLELFESSSFLPEIHRLIVNRAFDRIPFVWVNPNGKSTFISRDDHEVVKEKLLSQIRGH